MTDSLLERFAAVAPTGGRPDWIDVRRRARRRRVRAPVVLAAAVAALAVAAPAVGLVALLKSEPDYALTVPHLTSARNVTKLTGEVRDGRIRTVVLAVDGRPERRRAVGPARTYSFRLSSKDFGRCGALYGLDAHGWLIAALGVPLSAGPPPPPPKEIPRGKTRVPAPC